MPEAAAAAAAAAIAVPFVWHWIYYVPIAIVVLSIVRWLDRKLLPDCSPQRRAFDARRSMLVIDGIRTTQLRFTNNAADAAANRKSTDAREGAPPLLVMVIPGNPGSIGFYVPFITDLMSAIEREDAATNQPPRPIEICSIEHAGHSTLQNSTLHQLHSV